VGRRSGLRSFEFIPHTAEAGIRVQADTLEELYRGALEGIAEWLKPGLPRRADKRERIAVSSVLPNTLLVDFLIDVLTRSQIGRTVFFELEMHSLEEDRLECTLLGRCVDQFDDDIKAITYHGAGIRGEDGRYETEVIFDI
jgi:SHS2 domain-containing protein